MIRPCLLLLAALSMAMAQDTVIPLNFQPRAAAPAPAAMGRGGAVMLPRAEPGRPFSATVTSQTMQTLGDGTHLNRTITSVEYRDSDGRTRTENKDSVTIHDPVAGATYRLDPSKKSATVMTTPPAPAAFGTMRGGRGGVMPARVGATPEAAPVDVAIRRDAVISAIATLDAQARSNPNETSEDLGTSIVNGVSARGTRVTSVIPVGAIGNDRELRSVTERWFSNDLNLLIKSISTDPRFGTTTYELTNIKQAEPDQSLFQVPSDYTTVGGRGR